MANKIRDYTKLAADICAAVGKDNILSATHCATRLRLVLRETPSDEVTKQIPINSFAREPALARIFERHSMDIAGQISSPNSRLL